MSRSTYGASVFSSFFFFYFSNISFKFLLDISAFKLSSDLCKTIWVLIRVVGRNELY